MSVTDGSKSSTTYFNKVSTLWTCQTYLGNIFTVLKSGEIVFEAMFLFCIICVSYGCFWNFCPNLVSAQISLSVWSPGSWRTVAWSEGFAFDVYNQQWRRRPGGVFCIILFECEHDMGGFRCKISWSTRPSATASLLMWVSLQSFEALLPEQFLSS